MIEKDRILSACPCFRTVVRLACTTFVGTSLSVPVTAAPPEYRNWTIGGSKELRAKFVPGTGIAETVTLEEASGETTIVDFNKIAAADQEYIDLWYVTDKVEEDANKFLLDADLVSFLRARDNAIIDYKVSDRAAFFPGKINGEDFKFFLDTGAFASFMDDAAARDKLGLEPTLLSEDQWAGGVDGIGLRTFATMVDTIEFGEVKLRKHRMRTVDIAKSQYASFRTGRLRLDAVLGYDLLDELDAVITYKGKRIFIPKNLIEKSTEAPSAMRDTLPVLNVKATDIRGLRDSVGTPVNVQGMIRRVEDEEGGLKLHFFGRRVTAMIPKEVVEELPGDSNKRFANQDAKVSGLLKEVKTEIAGRERTSYHIDVVSKRFIEVNEVWKPKREDYEKPPEQNETRPDTPVDLSEFTLGEIIGYRTWVDRFDKKLRARPVTIEDNTHLKLITPNGRKYALPISDLSEQDQAFLKKWPNPTDGNLMGTFLQTVSLPEFTKNRGYESVDFKARDNNLWVKIEVEGKLLDFFVDTGAQTTGMGYEAAEKLGLDLESKGSVMGWGGKPVPAFEGIAKDFKIGSAAFNDVKLTVIPASWDGILGWDFLEKLDAAIDYKNKVMYFKK